VVYFFHSETTDKDDRSGDYTYKWVIEDKNQDDSDNTDTYEDKDIDFEPSKKFQSEGGKKGSATRLP
jgi:hypothetical protein